ncbi:MAG: DUF309 domain-containing protein [Kyrpidia sp.]|nr:DUF309 domain-containing protein [Kyrpidia sp.]
MAAYPRYFVDFVYLFNVERAFYDCHEYGEQLWMEQGRPPFLKGLIQTAVSLYHLESGNLGGARKLWRTAKAYLAPHQPVHMGLDVEGILRDMDDLFDAPGGPAPDRAAPVRLRITDPHLQKLLIGWRVEPLDEQDSTGRRN